MHEGAGEALNPEEMFALGAMLDEGTGVPPDYAQAFSGMRSPPSVATRKP